MARTPFSVAGGAARIDWRQGRQTLETLAWSKRASRDFIDGSVFTALVIFHASVAFWAVTEKPIPLRMFDSQKRLLRFGRSNSIAIT